LAAYRRHCSRERSTRVSRVHRLGRGHTRIAVCLENHKARRELRQCASLAFHGGAAHTTASSSDVKPISLAKRGSSDPEQTVLDNRRIRAPCGGSIPESAGGVRRRFGEGLLTRHHFRKQPPGHRSERETVMSMAKGDINPGAARLCRSPEPYRADKAGSCGGHRGGRCRRRVLHRGRAWAHRRGSRFHRARASP
jgi:hypothetical protein